MIYKILNVLLSFIIRPWVFILLNAGTFIFSFYCLKALFSFIHFFSATTAAETEDMSETLNGIAGVLVAIGVLLEERETIQKMSGITPSAADEYLNEVAHHNGLGLLLIGLFMEIVTLMIGSPKAVINTSGIEVYLFIFCFLLVVFSMLVELDLIKDYVKTYFGKRGGGKNHSST